MALVHANKPCFRFLILFFNCLLCFGSYFFYDMPSVLQSMFQANATHHDNETDSCSDGLGLSSEQYNLLYAIYAWTNAAVVIGAGFLVDKMGNRVGLLLFSFLCLSGSSIFALGSHFCRTTAMFPLMLVGRLLFGSGNGALSIVHSRISAYWFRDKELAMAFGATLAFSRLGSVVNFVATVKFAENYGLEMALWGGATLCGVSFLSAIILGQLDTMGISQRGQAVSVQEESRQLKFTDIRHFGLQYWFLVLAIMFFYSGLFPFVADASKFIMDKYHYKQSDAAYTAGAVYFVSMISPIVGYVIDIIGKRGYFGLMSGVLALPAFGVLAFTTHVPPLVCTIWLGIAYTLAVSSLFPSIPLIISKAAVGTAMGINISIQMIGVGISNAIVGGILEARDYANRWRHVMTYLMGVTLLSIVMSIMLNILDYKRERVLNQSRKQRLMRQMLEEHLAHCDSVNIGDGNEPTECDPLLIGRPAVFSAQIN